MTDPSIGDWASIESDESRALFLRDRLDGIEADERFDALRRLATVTRSIIDEVMRTGASRADVEAATDHLRAALDALERAPHGRPYVGGESSLMLDPANRNFVEFSPLVGRSNPLAPPLRLDVGHADDGQSEVVGSAVFSAAYEGPPGHVHGGFVAAAFDEVLGFVQSLTGRPGMTGRLQIRYRHPTPLYRELAFRGRVVKVEGRKIFTEGTLHDGDTLCAEAEGLFISIEFSRFAGMLAERRANHGDEG